MSAPSWRVSLRVMGDVYGGGVSTMFDGPNQKAPSPKSIIHNQWHTFLMRRLCNRLKIRDIILRIPNALDIYRLCLVVYRGRKVFCFVSVDKFRLDPKAWEKDFELVVGPAIQEGGGDNIVPRVCERCDGHELCGHARGCRDGRDTALERGNALLEYVVRWLEYL